MADLSAQQSDGKLRATFFRSITIVTSAAAIILAGSEGTMFPAAVTPVIAVMGWVLVDHFRWLKIPVLLGNLAGLLAFFVAASEFMGGTLETKLLSGSHLIVYLTWIVLILPKSHRQYWWLIALCVLQLAIAGLLSGDVGFGGALLGMMLLLMWTLSLFSLFRVQDQHAIRAVESREITQGVPDSTRAKGKALSAAPGTASPDSLDRWEKWKQFFRTFLGLNWLSGRQAAASEIKPVTTISARILIRNGLQRDSSETWVGWRFRGMVTGSYAVSVVLALIVFAAFPRVWVQGSSLFGEMSVSESGSGSRTGFSDTVELGDIGEIMQSNDRVLAFEIENLKTRQKVTAEAFADAMKMDEIRFRGNVLAFYAEGRWSRGFSEKGYGRGEETRRFGDFVQLESDFLMRISHDPPIGAFAFAPYPVSRAKAESGIHLAQTEVSGTLMWSSRALQRDSSLVYSVELPRLDLYPEATFEFWCIPDHIPAEELANRAEQREQFAKSMFLMDGFEGSFYRMVQGQRVLRPREYSNVNDLRYKLPRLFELARDLCTRNGSLIPAEERIARIVSFLGNENGFSYSLKASRSNRTIDPVEDFLLNTKTGHCEYFASACTMMLQAVDVPARLINGYYGCELNTLTGKYEVRQRHAHAWTEAFVNGRWETVEPTPSADRLEVMATKDSTNLITNIQTAISDFWNDGIHKMSAERQKEFFQPVISTSKSLYATIREQGLITGLRSFAKGNVSTANGLSSVLKWLGLLAIIVGAGLSSRTNAFKKLVSAVQSVFRFRSWKQKRTARSVIRFYEGFCLLCERNGLAIPPANSALENAELAVRRFAPLQASAELRTLPARIAIAFNEVRFGSLILTDEQTAALGRDLHALAEALKPGKQTASA